jgi:RHS repeat-associated protein
MTEESDPPREPDRPAGRRAVGHPVDVASGVFFLAWHDVEVGGYAPLVLRRYYSTSLPDASAARLGPGWTHNFAIALVESPDGYSMHDQNGSVIWFPRPEDATARSIFNAASSMELRAEDDWLCVYHWHDWKTTVEKLWFRRSPDGAFVLERISPPSGFGVVLAYDWAGRLATVTQAIEGRRLTFGYDERNRLSELLVGSPSSLDRRVASYSYDAQGRLAEVSDALGTPIRYAYDAAGRMISEATRSGAVFRVRYDARGRCVETRGHDGFHAVRLQYAMDGRVTIVTNSLGGVTTFELNASGQVLRETRPDGAVLAIVYDDLGRIVEEVDPLGGSTRYTYDEASNTASVSYPSGISMEAEYDDDHQPVFVRVGDASWRFTYDRGQLSAIVDARGVTRRYGYDPRGFLAAVREPNGNTIRIEADEAWAQVRVSDDFGLDREDHYNDLMDLTRRVEPDGGVHQYDFDAAGRIVAASQPGLPPQIYRYDATGCLASFTDEAGYTTELRHNVYGLLEQVLTPGGRTYLLRWDTEGNLRTWTNPAGETAEFAYDAVGNRTEMRHFDGRAESLVFDRTGRVIRRHLPDGTTLSFEYDLANNLLRLHSGGVDLITSEYDGQGRLMRTRTPDAEVAFEYDGGLRIAAEIQGQRRVSYGYDGVGALATRTFDGSPLPPLEFEWDRRNRLVATRRGGALVQTLRYDAKDQCIAREFGRCVERVQYSAAGTVIGQTVSRDGAPIVERRWSRDARRNVIGIDDRLSGEERYRYDADHRLVESSSNGTSTEYTYDANGNVAGWTGALARVFEYGPGNQLARAGSRFFERDANGRVTSIVDGADTTSLRWDALGQLVEVRHPDGAVTRYAYDGLGRRVRREAGGTVTEYVWAGEQLLAELSDGVVTEALTNDFTPVTLWRNSEVFHLINSHLGVPQEAVTDRGALAWSQRLDVWGDVKRVDGDAAGPIAFRFPGQYATDGFHYNRYRYYDPYACQYLSPDPMWLRSGANEYSYCPNPINWVDPFGLSCGIPPGTHTVYVLEAGKRGSPGPPPVKPTPPTPPVVIYVGITVQSPHARFSQHQNKPPNGVTPDGMRIVATVPSRTDARLLEASILTNHPGTQPTGGAGVGSAGGGLNNAPRPVNGGYYHSNVPSSAPPGTTHLPPSTTNPMLNDTHSHVPGQPPTVIT